MLANLRKWKSSLKKRKKLKHVNFSRNMRKIWRLMECYKSMMTVSVSFKKIQTWFVKKQQTILWFGALIWKWKRKQVWWNMLPISVFACNSFLSYPGTLTEIQDHVCHHSFQGYSVILTFTLFITHPHPFKKLTIWCPVFRIQIADVEYRKGFEDELQAFKDRIKRRAKEKIEAAVAEAEEEEKLKRLGPGGLDPVEVFESLPEVKLSKTGKIKKFICKYLINICILLIRYLKIVLKNKTLSYFKKLFLHYLKKRHDITWKDVLILGCGYQMVTSQKNKILWFWLL